MSFRRSPSNGGEAERTFFLTQESKCNNKSKEGRTDFSGGREQERDEGDL